jgi:hypothetical protein
MQCQANIPQLIICRTAAFVRNKPLAESKSSICRQFLRELKIEQLYETYRNMSRSPIQVLRHNKRDYLVYFASICPSAVLLNKLGFRQLDINHDLVVGVKSKMKPSYLKYIFGGLLAATLASILYAAVRVNRVSGPFPVPTTPSGPFPVTYGPTTPSGPATPLPMSSGLATPPSGPFPVTYGPFPVTYGPATPLPLPISSGPFPVTSPEAATPLPVQATCDILAIKRTIDEIYKINANRRKLVQSKFANFGVEDLEKCLDIMENDHQKLELAQLYEFFDLRDPRRDFLKLHYNTIADKIDSDSKIELEKYADKVREHVMQEHEKKNPQKMSYLPAVVDWKNDDLPARGIKNLGNSCYSNSVMQLFYNVEPIRKYASEAKSDNLISYVLRKLTNGNDIIDDEVTKLYVECGFNPKVQSDASELMGEALNKLPNEVKNIFKFTTNVFLMCADGGLIEIKSTQNEVHYSMMLDIPEPNLTIQDLYDKVNLPKIVGVTENIRSLEGCKQPVRMELMHNFGSYVIIQLKRFDEKGNKKDTVVFPNNDLKLYNDRKYVLRGVVNHRSLTSASGHYVFYRKLRDGTWILLDDAKPIQTISENPPEINNGYIYLYSYEGPWIL